MELSISGLNQSHLQVSVEISVSHSFKPSDLALICTCPHFPVIATGLDPFAVHWPLFPSFGPKIKPTALLATVSSCRGRAEKESASDEMRVAGGLDPVIFSVLGENLALGPLGNILHTTANGARDMNPGFFDSFDAVLRYLPAAPGSTT